MRDEGFVSGLGVILPDNGAFYEMKRDLRIAMVSHRYELLKYEMTNSHVGGPRYACSQIVIQRATEKPGHRNHVMAMYSYQSACHAV